MSLLPMIRVHKPVNSFPKLFLMNSSNRIIRKYRIKYTPWKWIPGCIDKFLPSFINDILTMTQLPILIDIKIILIYNITISG